MAKEDYLEGYGKGLQTGTKNPVSASITRTLDMALGNPHESAKRGYDQGIEEMKAAKKAEANRSKIINKPSSEVQKFDENYKRGGKVSSASKRADGCCIKGKTKGKMV